MTHGYIENRLFICVLPALVTPWSKHGEMWAELRWPWTGHSDSRYKIYKTMGTDSLLDVASSVHMMNGTF